MHLHLVLNLDLGRYVLIEKCVESSGIQQLDTELRIILRVCSVSIVRYHYEFT